MKVCLLSGTFPPMRCEVGDYSARLAAGVAACGAEVCVLTSAATEAVGKDAVPVRREIHDWGPGAVSQIATALDEMRPDLLHIQFPTVAYGRSWIINLLPLFLQRRGIQIPVVTTLHEYGGNSGFARLRQLASMATSDGVIATNEVDHRLLRRSLWLRGKPLGQIPLGNSIAVSPRPGYSRERWREKMGVGEQEILACYFGSLSRNKQAHVAISSVAELVAHGLPMKLLIIAGTANLGPAAADYYLELLNQADALGISQRVIWSGYVTESEVSSLLMSADLCLLPFAEGVSFRRMTLLAALAHGVPVVSTRPEWGVPEGLLDGQNILMAPVRGGSELFTGMVERLVVDPALRAQLSRASRELAAAFRWDAIARSTLSFYARLLRPATRPSPGAAWTS